MIKIKPLKNTVAVKTANQHKKTKIIFALFFLFCASSINAIDFLPPKEVFASPIADLTYPAFSTKYTLPVGKKNLAEISLGDEFGIMRFNFENSFLQFGIMGGLVGRFDISRITNDLQIADYTLAFPFDYVNGKWILRLMYWHTSSHIGDDYIASNAITPPSLRKNVTDDVRILQSFDLFEWLRIYQGYFYSFNMLPDTDKPHGFNYGFEIYLPLTKDTPTKKQFFLASDFKALQRLGWQPSVNVRTGIEFGGEKNTLSLFTEFFAGHILYLGFMNRTETHWAFGFSFSR
ncbi:MAG TPA: DUF1207 domain-containing protein [Elusimicrobiales bacterium]|nr:DUF1207 domain-containing protein [Elusimicrobiales bacterium]